MHEGRFSTLGEDLRKPPNEKPGQYSPPSTARPSHVPRAPSSSSSTHELRLTSARSRLSLGPRRRAPPTRAFGSRPTWDLRRAARDRAGRGPVWGGGFRTRGRAPAPLTHARARTRVRPPALRSPSVPRPPVWPATAHPRGPTRPGPRADPHSPARQGTHAQTCSYTRAITLATVHPAPALHTRAENQRTPSACPTQT